MNKKFILLIFISFVFGCNSIKFTQKIANKSSISIYSDEKSFIDKWEKKWNKIYSVETKQSFESQASTVLSKQMITLEDFIKNGQVQDAKIQATYVLNTFNYVKNKNENIDYLKNEKNLNETYLARSENLAKISLANINANNRNFSEWQKIWNELSPNVITEQYQYDAFVKQSNLYLEKLILNVKNYIKLGQEQNCNTENELLKNNYNFVRTKIPKYDKESNKIEDLNDEYLAKVPILAKMEHANIYMKNDEYENWRVKWLEVIPYIVSVDYIKKEFISQAKTLLNKQINTLNNHINRADEKNTEITQKALQINYDFTREKYPNFDNEFNNIPNLNDIFIASAVNLAKISRANIYVNNSDFNNWIIKWQEIGENLSEQYLIDAFENQSFIVFSTLYSSVTTAKENNDCSEWEETSDLIVDILEKTLVIYPNFDNYRSTKPQLENIKVEYLNRSNRDSKICIAENFLNSKNYNKWIGKWGEIENKHFLNSFEIKTFNTDCKTAFGYLLQDIDAAISLGNYAKTQNLSNLTLDLLQSKVLSINPNFVPTYFDLNEIYLFNAKFFARAQSYFLNGQYLTGIDYLLKNCENKLASPELLPSFSDFFVQTLKKTVDIYKLSVQKVDFDKQVADLKLMSDIYNLKPDYLSITYTPEYLNPRGKYKPFKVWLDWRTTSTVTSLFAHADSLINQNLYTLAYDFVYTRAIKILDGEDAQEKIDYYDNIFETSGTDYYKSQINIKIQRNKYIIAKQILDVDLMKINPDFNNDRRNEYNQLLNDIRNKGTNYFISQRDKMIENQEWDNYCHNYCDSIQMINPSYDNERCHDEIDFEKNYFTADNKYKNGYYFCAIDILDEIVAYNVPESRRSRAYNLVSDCKNQAVLSVGVSVDNNYLSDDLDSYIVSQLQNYKNNYRFSDYLEIKSNSNANYTVNLTINNFSYSADWTNSETKYACIVYTRDDKRTRTVTNKVKKTVVKGDFTYFVVKNSTGLEFLVRLINGYYYYLGDDGQLYLMQSGFDYIYVDETSTESYIVKQYKYEKVSYKVKTGKEKMNFYGKIEFKDNNGNYVKYSKNKNFTNSNTYLKYEKLGSYNIKNLVQVPSGTLNTWLDNSYYCSDFDESPFNAPSDPFQGKNEYYQNTLKKELRSFIRSHVPNMMEYVKEKHSDMQCD